MKSNKSSSNVVLFSGVDSIFLRKTIHKTTLEKLTKTSPGQTVQSILTGSVHTDFVSVLIGSSASERKDQTSYKALFR